MQLCCFIRWIDSICAQILRFQSSVKWFYLNALSNLLSWNSSFTYFNYVKFLFVLGLGLYQILAFINHSCEPNCVAVFNGPTCQIRSIRNVEKGEELCISYTELMRPHTIRQKELQEQYYFDCACSSCLKEVQFGSEMNGLKCANKECSNAVGFHPG